MNFISVLESALGKVAKKVYLDLQPGDVLRTYADISDLERDIISSRPQVLKTGFENLYSGTRSIIKLKFSKKFLETNSVK